MWVRIPLIEKRKEKPFWCLGLITRRNHHGVISLGLVCYCIHKKILCISCWRYNFFIVCVLLFVIWFPIGVHDLIPFFFLLGSILKLSLFGFFWPRNFQVLLQPDPFLNELTSMFERSTEKGSVWVTLKRCMYNLHSIVFS